MLSSKNVFDDEVTLDSPRYLSAADFRSEDRRTAIAPGDVLLTIVGTIGRSAVVPVDIPAITLQRSVAVIRPNPSAIDARFLMYSLIKSSDELNSQARGVAQKGVYLETLREFRLPHPPLPEQRRIVALLDEAFAGIATAKANAEKNLQNARELALALEEDCFEKHIDNSFSPRQLEHLCELIVDCEHKTAPTEETGYPSIRTPNIGRGILLLTNVNRVSEDTYRQWTRRATPLPGDLVLAREAPAGNVAVIPEGLAC